MVSADVAPCGINCSPCSGFTRKKNPCARLKRLQKRYAMKYGVEIYENLAVMRGRGMDSFIALETRKWACPACGERLCAHKAQCPRCGAPNPNLGPATSYERTGTK